MSRGRRGVTLVELLLVVALTGVVLMMATRFLLAHDRVLRTGMAEVRSRDELRAALSILTRDLREIDPSASSGDLAVAEPTRLRIRAPDKLAFVCSSDEAGVLDIAVLSASFAAGDSVLVFVEGDPQERGDDAWARTDVTGTSAGSAAGCPGGLTSATAQELRVEHGPAMDALRPGAPVRSFAWVEYRLEQGSRGWRLVRQLGSGPAVTLLDGLADPATAGDPFQYLDPSGAAAADPAQVARVVLEFTARASARRAGEPVSLATAVTLRGR